MNVNSKLVMVNILPPIKMGQAVDTNETGVLGQDEVSKTVGSAYDMSAAEILSNYNQSFIVKMNDVDGK